MATRPEIYWTAIDGDNSTLIPGGITQIAETDGELRISFAGQQGPQGDRYQGILRILLRAGDQTAEGRQSYKTVDGPWEPVTFSLVGRFEDERFTTFTGLWIEDDMSIRVEIVGLPGVADEAVTRRPASKPPKSRGRKKSRGR